MEITLQLTIVAVLILLSGFFASSETALFSLSKIERRRVEKAHPQFSKWLTDHLEHPRRTLITILIGNLFVNVLATSFVTLIAMKHWGPGGVSLALVLFTLILILLGEILPKLIAVRMNERFSLILSPPLRIFSILIWPFRILTQKITDAILSLQTVVRKESSNHISEEELKAMVKIGEEDGVLDRQERYMIQKLFELGERPVKDILTPRIDVKGLDVENSREEHMERIRRYHYTHFPVYKETRDDILGVVSAQEYMLSEDKRLGALLKQPLFVPETKRIDDLLAELTAKNLNFAIVVDEYGGTAGIVTLEDILEEIFGEYYDEYAKVEQPIRPFGHHEYIVDAKISLDDFNEFFSIQLEAHEASSLGGFIFEKLGEIPKRGDILELEQCDIHIHEVLRRRRIHRVIVRKKN